MNRHYDNNVLELYEKNGEDKMNRGGFVQIEIFWFLNLNATTCFSSIYSGIFSK